MCGYVGFTDSDKIENSDEVLKKMTSRIIHRGPDMEGEYIDGSVALGFRRLSIIDLREAGNQPMTNEDGTVILVYNGEIYNFKEIREALTAAGHVFKTNCDSEVIIHGYEEYGVDIVPRLRGMFSFVLWDKRDGTVFGARDYLGIKPFYYGRLPDDGYIFGSEIKSFLDHPKFIKKVNRRALLPYLTFQYSACDETFFEGVFKLPPAHTFRLAGDSLEIKRYWDIDFRKKTSSSFEDSVNRLDCIINESVRAHEISDVKVGTFLSGGVDSSYITAAMMPDKTFSVGFDYNKFNETDYAAELSGILGIKNFKKMLTADECFDAFPDIQYHMDEPQSNPSSVPLYFLSKLASEQVTVVLSGEGADEIFAGYEWYDETPVMKKYKKLPQALRLAAAAAAKRLPYFKGHDFIIKNSGRPEDYFIGQALVFPEKEAAEVLKPEYKSGPTPHAITGEIYKRTAGLTELEKKQYLDLNLWLPGDILLKADKMSMAHSLELRVPFLDREVIAFAGTLPSAYKINGKNTKYILRCAANKTVPDEWADRKKMGFPVPIRYWLREDKYYNIVLAHFKSSYAAEFFNTDMLVSLLERHRSGKENNGRKIWTVFTFLVWYKRFFIEEEGNGQ